VLEAQANLRQLPAPRTDSAATSMIRARRVTPIAQLLNAVGKPRAGVAEVKRGGRDGGGASDDEHDGSEDDAGERDELGDDERGVEDDCNRGRGERVAATATSERERIAAAVVASIAHHGNFVSWCRFVEWRSARNRHEVTAWAAALDAMVAEGITSDSTAMEIAVRRLAGVYEVDQGRSWAVAKALAWDAPGTLLPRTALKSALREASLAEKLEKKGKASSSSSRNSGSTWRGSSGGRGGAGGGYRYSRGGVGGGSGSGSGSSGNSRGGSSSEWKASGAAAQRK